MSVETLWPVYISRNIGISRCNPVINNVQLETPEYDPLRVETCSVTQISKIIVALTAVLVLLVLENLFTDNFQCLFLAEVKKSEM
jgi:hypothetical protein